MLLVRFLRTALTLTIIAVIQSEITAPIIMADSIPPSTPNPLTSLTNRVNNAAASQQRWHTAYLWLVAVAAIAAVAGFIAQWIESDRADQLSKANSALTEEKDRIAKVDSENKQLEIARLKDRASNAELEVERLKAKQASWDFSGPNRNEFVRLLKNGPKGKVLIQYTTADSVRGAQFANALGKVLKEQLGFDVWGYLGPFTSAGASPMIGVELSVKRQSEIELMNAIGRAFEGIGITASATRRSAQDATYPDDAVVISVGIKPDSQ